MKFTLVVHAAPDTQGSHSALSFARAALEAGHEIYRIFFYAAGVHNAGSLSIVPQDENNLGDMWHALITRHKIDAVVCIAAGLRRGVINNTEASRYEKQSASMSEVFDLSGLGQLLEAAVHSDRVLTFGD